MTEERWRIERNNDVGKRKEESLNLSSRPEGRIDLLYGRGVR